ncbi:sugar ABC transporter permease [Brenneria populi subsp. brevivirga]|uniref:carbohydrate ABC transporter permease n=1 Tax=Brenneria populi TaxID=1505588 RepID=UPI002E1761C8|nr:sugar ABC transporter permease [Brenneria populi subsp. brevivirga]
MSGQEILSDRSLAALRRKRRDWWPWLALAPLIVIILALMVTPVIHLFSLVAQEVEWQNGKAVTRFVGLDNIRAFLHNPYYWTGLGNTLLFSVIAVLLQVVIGFALALAVSNMRKEPRLLTAILLLPIVISPIVIGAMWRLILNNDSGVLNVVLDSLNILPPDWLGTPVLAFISVIVVDVWHWTPFSFLLLLAGLKALPQEVLEAAQLDGCSRWQRLRYVILPMMWPALLITLMLRIIFSFKVFDEIYLLTKGGPGTATEMVSYSIYRAFFVEDREGLGAVMSLFTFFIVALLLVVLVNLRKRRAD